MFSLTDIPEKNQQVFTINTSNLFDFELVRSALLDLVGVEDVLYDDRLSPAEVTLLTDGTISNTTIQQLVWQEGYQMQPKHLQTFI
ncbi:MAG: hypothetical protein AAGE93_12450 [Bacteroidota bacterium]